jgi:hypothetical protein
MQNCSRTGYVFTNSWAGLNRYPIELVKETPKRYRVKLLEACRLPHHGNLEAGAIVLVPKDSVRWEAQP